MLRCPHRGQHRATYPRLKRFLTSPTIPLTIGIRREDPARLWERRCPITPSAVEELVRDAGVRVLVQDCHRRVYRVHEFEEAGATVHSTLSPAHIILGIKETPLADLLPQSGPLPLGMSNSLVPRTHLMFSHTGKGQSYNMPLLSKFIQPEEGIAQREPEFMERLIDYELLTNGPPPKGKRVVAFGWYAGAAGAVEGLCASAHDFLSFGVASPFLHLPRPYMSRTLTGLRASLNAVGELIACHGTPEATGPFVIAVTGNGNVAHGALDILGELPHAYISPSDLPSLISSRDTDLHKVYVTHVTPSDYLVPSDGSPRGFDRSAYYTRPSEWKSVFYEKVAPYTTLLINGAGWQPGFPRLMTNEQLNAALKISRTLSERRRLRTVADVSCDVQGGLEFVERSTTIDAPFFTARPSRIQIMSVDILPTQLPADASAHFSSALVPYLRTLIRHYQGNLKSDDSDRLDALDRATIAQHGELQGVHKWLAAPLSNFRDKEIEQSPSTKHASEVASEKPSNTKERSTTFKGPRKNILLLGSGMVARPAVEEFAKREDVHLIVASNNASEARAVARGFSNVLSKLVDLADIASVEKLVKDAHIVVSLLPVPLHPVVAKLCIAHRKHMVTASYISPEMKELHSSALDSDIILLNEIGLDPGIDHCSAISLLQRLRAQNKTVKSFVSFCGGLPAPEHAEVPLGYKFSWSPRGVLGAALNAARFKLMGEEYNVHGEDLLQSRFPTVPLSKYMKFEGIPNRDSLPYAKIYKLGCIDALDTVLRGTLRYPGFSSLMHSFQRIGLLETERPLVLNGWSSLASRALAAKFAIRLADNDFASFYSALTNMLDVPRHELSELMYALTWLGISPIPGDYNPLMPNSSREYLITPPSTSLPPIDLFTLVLAQKLRYHSKERDMVVLLHEITVSRAPSNMTTVSVSPETGGQEEETHTSTLVTYGSPSDSAMSRTVGIPVALATLSILDGHVHARGVQGPTMQDVYGPVLRGLEENGLGMKENMRTGNGSGRVLRDGLLEMLEGGKGVGRRQ